MPKEQYMCQLCANHGFFNQPKKGHKQKCPYKECSCEMCALNTKRRTLDQIERQLRQLGQGAEECRARAAEPAPAAPRAQSAPTVDLAQVLHIMPLLFPQPMPISRKRPWESSFVSLDPTATDQKASIFSSIDLLLKKPRI